MREAQPLDDDTVAALEAIDATLHGEPVDPDFADLAELSLILRGECPQPAPAFLAALDARAAERFVARPRRSSRRARSPRRLWWSVGSALGGVAVVVLVLVTVHFGGSGQLRTDATSGPASKAKVISSSTAASAPAAAASASSATRSGVAAGSASGAASTRQATVPAQSPAPRSGNGRDVTRSAQLVLRARSGRVDAVAQEVFDVIGAEHGVVSSSHVVDRAHGSGSARFALQVPSGRLQTTLTRLSSLRGAQVTSRVDASADITGEVNTTAARLAAAHALRRSLLAQLAAASTSTLAARLQASLRRNDSQIVADAGALARLHTTVSDSTAHGTQPCHAGNATSADGAVGAVFRA